MAPPPTAMGAVVPEQLAARRDERARHELQPRPAAACNLRAPEQFGSVQFLASSRRPPVVAHISAVVTEESPRAKRFHWGRDASTSPLLGEGRALPATRYGLHFGLRLATRSGASANPVLCGPHFLGAWLIIGPRLRTTRPSREMSFVVLPGRGRVCHQVPIFIRTCSITAMIVCVCEHVQWRFVRNGRLARGWCCPGSTAR
jgi:hypothetical protein